jgi:exodeoxyribonuclease VII large subunit
LTKVASLRQKIEFESRAMTSAVLSMVSHCSKDISLVEGKLKEMSPLAVLRRGYAIALKTPEKLVLKSASDAEAGGHVKIILAEGELECTVEKVTQH